MASSRASGAEVTSMARPRFVATGENRRMVRSLVAYGISQEEIGRCVGIRSSKTLRRHFREELDRGATEANARVAQSLYQLAISGKCVAATIFWMKTRAWQIGRASCRAR